MGTPYFINSIYLATEGEGVYIGTPQVFVRFQGCNIGCANCDSKETWEFTETSKTKAQVVKDILAKARPHDVLIKRLSITGGDPLHPKHEKAVAELVTHFKSLGFFINIEASGTRVLPDIFDQVDFVSFDFKTPSTQVQTPLELVIKMAREYQGKFQIKSVAADEKDVVYAFEGMKAVEKALGVVDFPWVLTPVYNTAENFPQERFIQVIKCNEKLGAPFRVIGQQHKMIYGSTQKDI